MHNKWLEAEKKKKTRGSVKEEFLPDETTTAARSTSGRRSATQPALNYCIDVIDAGSSASVATKRMSSQGGSAAPTGEKAAKFASGERGTVRSRRTPTPVGLAESELHIIDDRLVLRIPISDSEVYRSRAVTPRLQLLADNHLPKTLISRWKESVDQRPPPAWVASGLIAVHSDVNDMVDEGDCRRAEELEWVAEVPGTSTWALQTSSSFSFDSPGASFVPVRRDLLRDTSPALRTRLREIVTYRRLTRRYVRWRSCRVLAL